VTFCDPDCDLKITGDVSSSLSRGQAPLARDVDKGRKDGGADAGMEAVAVADEAVAEDCDVPICIVAEETVLMYQFMDVYGRRCGGSWIRYSLPSSIGRRTFDIAPK
jgi:hypothetical protein